MSAIFQTRRKGKKLNRKTNILLFRNFAPDLRKYSYEEFHPKWEDISALSWWSHLSDSLYLDSIIGHDAHVLNQVMVKAKRTKYKKFSLLNNLSESIMIYRRNWTRYVMEEDSWIISLVNGDTEF